MKKKQRIIRIDHPHVRLYYITNVNESLLFLFQVSVTFNILFYPLGVTMNPQEEYIQTFNFFIFQIFMEIPNDQHSILY